MEVDIVRTADLASMAAEYNPRKISESDLSALRRSLRFFGCVEPVVVNRRTSRIVGGHQRVRAAQAEGVESLLVVWVDLDEPSERQLNLALNRIHGEWDEERLAALLAELERQGADLELTGFDDDELARLLDAGIAPAEGLVDPDETPEPPEEPAARPGDLIVLGDHRLLCGDSTSPADVTRAMDGARAGCLWTDPPYGVSYVGGTKDAFVLGHSDYHYQHEPILYGYKPIPEGEGRLGRGAARWYGDNAQASVLAVDRPKVNADHPTSKPVELIERCLHNSTRRGDVVFEPFGGSGSTLIACERLGRSCRAVEIDPRYVDVIVARWQAFTGKAAEGWRGNDAA